MEEIIWQCPCGDIKGALDEGAAVFRGVPYAETKRFEAPQLVESWNGVYDGTKEEKDCYQFSAFQSEEGGFYAKEFRSNRSFVYDESPMTLNIVSPVGSRGEKQKNCPVLLFIHGGSFETGTVGELPYGTTKAYAKEDVVFISIGYRLNVFGLYGGTNYMLLDQIAAVDWVKRNISAFGGNADNITLIGQSAGAMCVFDLLCSPLLKGKIKGAIMMSGAGVFPKFGEAQLKEAVAPFWKNMDEILGEDAKEAPAKELWFAWKKARNTKNPLVGLRASQPCVDGVTLLKRQREIVKKGKLLDVPLMVGVTSQDMLPIFLYDMALKLGLSCAKQHHQPVYGYFFDRTLPGNSYKAFHACDLWYMFGNMNQSWRPFEETDYRLHEEMVRDVAEFCKTGKPQNLSWTPISGKTKGFRHYDGTDRGMVYPDYCKKKVRHAMFFDRGPA